MGIVIQFRKIENYIRERYNAIELKDIKPELWLRQSIPWRVSNSLVNRLFFSDDLCRINLHHLIDLPADN